MKYLWTATVFLMGCNTQPGADNIPRRDTVIHVHKWDSLPPETVVIHDTVKIPEKPAAEQPVKPGAAIRAGRHNFTLHWISWDHPGSVTITARADGRYDIKGGQKGRNNFDFITIDGVLTQITPLELKFEGRIEYKTESTNQGKVCVKQGDHYTFLSTKGRKYWRLQQMDNCEGGGLVDYIDIYF